MQRHVLLHIALLSIPGVATAQFDTVDTAWERSLGSPTYAGLQPVEVEAAPDGGVLVVGLARELPLNDYNLRADTVLIRLDENGAVMWTDTIPLPARVTASLTNDRDTDAAFDSQGNVYVVASRHSDASVLRRYDAGGTMAWEVDVAIGGFNGTTGWHECDAVAIGVQPSGDVVVAGNGLDGVWPRVDVRAFGPDGTPRWEWRGDFGAYVTGYTHGMALGPDGSVYLYGVTDRFASFWPRIIALDASGSFRWDVGFPFGGEVAGMDFDSQGDVLALVPWSPGFVIHKIRSDGAIAFTNLHSDAGVAEGGSCIAVDGLDRISVGGWSRVPPSGPRDATLFRFDPNGAFLGRSIPSVENASQDGFFEHLHVTTRNDVVALGGSITGSDKVILARFAPDGSERWAIRRRGGLPLPSVSTSVDLALKADPRGNLFTLVQTIEGGAFPNQTLGLDLAKHVQNGPPSDTYCGPAQLNSTGSAASIRALGPRSVTAANLTLRADDLPPGAFTLLLASRMQGNIPNAGGGQGTLCLSGEVGRFLEPGQVQSAALDGSASLQLHLPQIPQPTGFVAAMAGESWNFQAWYRDANPGVTSNFTNGVQVMLQ